MKDTIAADLELVTPEGLHLHGCNHKTCRGRPFSPFVACFEIDMTSSSPRETSTPPAKERKPFLTARWEHLVMLNYLVDPSVLAGRIPRGTELDTFEGHNFVSIVGFRFLDTRVIGIPIPWHRNFEEINLRFYVRRETGGETRRGVVFIKEIVPRPMIALIARLLYNENYVSMPMTHFDEVGWRKESRVAYAFRHSNRTNRVEVRACGEPYLPAETSEEAFITEHYWGYARQRDGSTLEYEVRHPRWNVWRTSEARFDGDAGEIYGPDLGGVLSASPHSAFLADGSAVAVYRGTPL